jgi:hypothetical protein
MTYYSDQKYEYVKDGRTYHWRLEPDWYAEIDTMGEYTTKEGTFRIDRLEGWLFGDRKEEPEEPVFVLGEEVDTDVMDAYDAAYDAWYEMPYEILADVHSGYYQHSDYRYFIPFCAGLDPNDPETDLAEWELYAKQDWERMWRYERQDWCYVGVIVWADAESCPCCGNIERIERSVWGVESDCEDSDFEMFRDDLIYEIEQEIQKYEHGLERCKVTN